MNPDSLTHLTDSVGAFRRGVGCVKPGIPLQIPSTPWRSKTRRGKHSRPVSSTDHPSACHWLMGRARWLKRTRRPQAGRRMGRCRRPRRRSPSAPRGYDPTPPAGGAVESAAYARGRRHAGTPQDTCTQSVLHSLAPGPGGSSGTGWAGHVPHGHLSRPLPPLPPLYLSVPGPQIRMGDEKEKKRRKEETAERSGEW